MNWNISCLQCIAQEGDRQDIISVVHWDCTDTQVIDGKEYSGRVYATCTLPAPTDTFIPYASVTKQEVLDWIWANGVDKDSTEAAVNAQIQAQAFPTIVTPPLPWLPQAA